MEIAFEDSKQRVPLAKLFDRAAARLTVKVQPEVITCEGACTEDLQGDLLWPCEHEAYLFRLIRADYRPTCEAAEEIEQRLATFYKGKKKTTTIDLQDPLAKFRMAGRMILLEEVAKESYSGRLSIHDLDPVPSVMPQTGWKPETLIQPAAYSLPHEVTGLFVPRGSRAIRIDSVDDDGSKWEVYCELSRATPRA